MNGVPMAECSGWHCCERADNVMADEPTATVGTDVETKDGPTAPATEAGTAFTGTTGTGNLLAICGSKSLHFCDVAVNICASRRRFALLPAAAAAAAAAAADLDSSIAIKSLTSVLIGCVISGAGRRGAASSVEDASVEDASVEDASVEDARP